MAELPGFFVMPAQGGRRVADRGPLTADLWGFTYTPADDRVYAARASALIYGPAPRVTHLPVTVSAREITGGRQHCYFDEYYNAIHISPARYAFGTISTPQTIRVSVWNAYFIPKTLTALTGAEEGLSASGPETPITFAPLQQMTWEIAVSLQGPVRLDATLRWVFDVPAPAVSLTGDRHVVWPYPPSWQEPVVETLAWLTDILRSETGAEQRRALRRTPRRSFEAFFVAEGRGRAKFDLTLAYGAALPWVLPIWPDIQWLRAPVFAGATSMACDTGGRDFSANGLAVLMAADVDAAPFLFEVVTLDTVSMNRIDLLRPVRRDWPAGTRLYPGRMGRMAQAPEMLRKTDTVLTAQVTFDIDEPCDWPPAPDGQWARFYRGRPVLAPSPDESEDLTSEYYRIVYVLDNRIASPLVTDGARKDFAIRQHRWLLAGQAERDAFRRFLYWLRGSQRAVWLPTHASDLTPAAASGGTALRVENVHYATFGVGQLAQRDISITLTDGTVLDRRIVGAVEVDDATEELWLDADIPVLNRHEIARISYLTLARLLDDTVEIEHMHDVSGVARADLRFRGVRDDEL